MRLPSLHDLVDAELPLSEEQLSRIWTAAQRDRPVLGWEKAVFFSTFLGPLAALLALGAFLMDSTGYRRTVTAAMALLMCVWMCVAMTRLMKRPWYASAFRRELCRRGHPVCIACGHWLRGLKARTRRCPECGKRVWKRSKAENP